MKKDVFISLSYKVISLLGFTTCTRLGGLANGTRGILGAVVIVDDDDVGDDDGDEGGVSKVKIPSSFGLFGTFSGSSLSLSVH
mmetsp:Transcript_30400/g.39186  ORF Transcript_30400/g.39186 Transcript_30400/m.39186 type:complete len:83 (-) Transcript_30400:563-811(-)